MSAGDRKIPKVRSHVDVRALPISAAEGFLLSCVDGIVTVEELPDLSGLPLEMVEASLKRLDELGALDWVDRAVKRPRSVPTPVEGTAAATTAGPRIQAPRVPADAIGRPGALPSPLPSAPSHSGGARPSVSPETPFARPGRAPSGQAHPSSQLPRPPSGQKQPSSPPSRSEAQTSSRAANEPAKPRAIAQEADTDVDLDPERKLRVLDTYDRLAELDHYALLGIARTADKTEIRNAYFALSKIFHPDTLYGKRLGNFKPKMEAVFKQLTEAYEVLSKAKRRAEYDAQLGEAKEVAPRPVPQPAGAPNSELPGAGTRAPSPPPESVPRHAQAGSAPSSVTATTAASPTAPREPVRPAQSPAPPAAPLAPPQSSARPVTPPAEVARPAAPRVSPPPAPETPVPGMRASPPAPTSAPTSVSATSAPANARSEAHAAPKAPESPASPSPRAGVQGSAMRDLARALHQTGHATASGADRFAQMMLAARRFEMMGDVEKALELLRAARAQAPERADVQSEYERVSRLWAAAKANDLVAQAQADEKAGRWGAASLAWGRACEGRPNDAEAHRSAAQAFLRAGADIKRAKTYAQRAVDLAPNDVPSRIVLARVYIQAGLRLNAQRELEFATKLDPADQTVKNLLRDLAKE